jgi:hypothetical protein
MERVEWRCERSIPPNGETLATYDEMTPQQVGDIVDTVHNTFLAWRGALLERARFMRQVAVSSRATSSGLSASPPSGSRAAGLRQRRALRPATALRRHT